MKALPCFAAALALPYLSLSLIGRAFQCLGECLRRFLQPFLWKRANCRSKFLYGVSLGGAQCCVGEEGRELLAVPDGRRRAWLQQRRER